MEKSNGLQVILFPLPLQGCINPMIQLAKILHSRGFSITVIHTCFNAPRASSHPFFKLLQIPDGLSEIETRSHDVNLMLTLLNERCESPFRDCLTKLLQAPDSETERKKQMISCLIHDSGWTFTGSVAESLKLPRLVLNVYTISYFRSHFALPKLRRDVNLLSQGIFSCSDLFRYSLRSTNIDFLVFSTLNYHNKSIFYVIFNFQ